MNGEILKIDVSEMKSLIVEFGLNQSEQAIMLDSARRSHPLLVGMYNGELLCIVGLIPPTLLSDIAYLWCYDTPEARQHPIVFGRHARRLMAYIKLMYPKVIGHCANPKSIAWLQSLGANFTGSNSTAHEFEII